MKDYQSEASERGTARLACHPGRSAAESRDPENPTELGARPWTGSRIGSAVRDDALSAQTPSRGVVILRDAGFARSSG